MRIDILTLFPDQFSSVFSESIVKIAQHKGHLQINLVNWRDYAQDSHKTVDDRPYGGGSGMVLKVDVLDQALENIKKSNPQKKPHIILLTPRGERLVQNKVQQLVKRDWLILICGHYEGVDERVSEYLIDEEVSIGDYILSGGETAAMVMVDTLARLIPEVLGNNKSSMDESFSQNLLEYPQYTRPPEYKGWKVPEVLLSGDHEIVKKWRQEEAKKKTKSIRPDLISKDS